jgi:general stress protein YciG
MTCGPVLPLLGALLPLVPLSRKVPDGRGARRVRSFGLHPRGSPFAASGRALNQNPIRVQGGIFDETTKGGAQLPQGKGEGRGFAGMDEERRREVARMGGRAAHQKGTAHEFSPEEAREAGRKGGRAVSRDREHMSAIGREGGESRAANHTRRVSSESPVGEDEAETGD